MSRQDPLGPRAPAEWPSPCLGRGGPSLGLMYTLFTALTTLVSIVAAGVLAMAPSATSAHATVGLPPRLSETGLFVAGAPSNLGSGVVSFTPQYTLWSDGADKRRWIRLPSGAQIDASDPDAWQFPPGTRLWKEFAHGGRRVETRLIERGEDGRWRFAAYVWRADGSDADLAPARGVAAMPVAEAPQGRYDVPSRGDCLACHDGAAVPVLGFGALQLSPRRDAGAAPPHEGDVDLPALVARGWLRGLPPALLEQLPRIEAASDTERAALGYLHANCGHCHNDSGAGAPVRLQLAQRAADAADSRRQVFASAVGATARYRPQGLASSARVIVPGHPEDSVLVQRMRSRHAQTQMPPLGTQLPDPEGLALVQRWIANDLSATPPQETLQ